MQTMMVEVTNSNALKVLRSLSDKKQIRIVDEATAESPALPGRPMSLAAFKTWISNAENMDTVSLLEAKKIWAGKRKQLKSLTV